MPKAGHRRKYKKRNGLAKKVKTIQKTLALRRPETKYFEAYATNGSVSYDFSNLTSPYRSITQGMTDLKNRIGDKLTINGPIHFKGTFTTPAAVGTILVRMIAFVYKQNPDSVLTSFATIGNLYMESFHDASPQAPYSFRDYDNKSSFVTIYDRSKLITCQSSLVTGRTKWNATFKIPKKCRQIEYQAATANLSRNELYIMFLSEVDTASGVLVTYQLRGSYIDT